MKKIIALSMAAIVAASGLALSTPITSAFEMVIEAGGSGANQCYNWDKDNGWVLRTCEPPYKGNSGKRYYIDQDTGTCRDENGNSC